MIRRYDPTRRVATPVVLSPTQDSVQSEGHHRDTLWICVNVCSLISRERINQFTPDLTCLCLEAKKRFQKGRNFESVLSSSPGEGGLCSSETKHDRRAAPRRKLFVSTRLPDKGLNPENLFWVRVLVWMVSVAWQLWEPRTKLFVSAGR
jgi:hypothetical protein